MQTSIWISVAFPSISLIAGEQLDVPVFVDSAALDPHPANLAYRLRSHAGEIVASAQVGVSSIGGTQGAKTVTIPITAPQGQADYTLELTATDSSGMQEAHATMLVAVGAVTSSRQRMGMGIEALSTFWGNDRGFPIHRRLRGATTRRHRTEQPAGEIRAAKREELAIRRRPRLSGRRKRARGGNALRKAHERDTGRCRPHDPGKLELWTYQRRNTS